MLPAAARLTSGESFRRCVRAGHRAGSRTLVLHLAEGGDPSSGASSGASSGQASPQVGFVVSRAVGNAVVRNRVRRRLRHLVRDRLPELSVLPGGAVLVVRALPDAAGAAADELRSDLARCLERVLPRVQPAARDEGARVPR